MDPLLELMRGLLPSLLLIGALLWVRRAAAQGRVRAGSRMRVAERMGVQRGASVAVVEIDGRRFLVGATEHGINLLTELAEQPAADVPAADGSDVPGVPAFAELLRSVAGRNPMKALLK